MGVHTGDSITVAPAQTLTDKEYQRLRDASIAVLRKIGVDTGGSNVQFGISPTTGRVVVIEMNPRVSRSSALASKATGFPIAKVAAKLAVGYTLDELRNEITGGLTPASFEPSIDYVVTKIPRFAFEKVSPSRCAPDHADEVGGRGDGDGPHLPGIAAESAAWPGNRQDRPGSDRSGSEQRRRHRRAQARAQGAGPGASVLCRRRLPRRHDGGRGVRAVVHRPLVPGPDRRAHQPRTAAGRRRHGGAGCRTSAHAQVCGFLRRTSGRADRQQRRIGAHVAPRAGSAPGLQARGLVRCRIRHQHRLHVFDLRGRMRSAADRSRQDHDSWRRPQPHRPGYRVRLLLRARSTGAAR